jgi:hypothetical protein
MLQAQEQLQQASTQATQHQELVQAQEEQQRRMTRGVVDEHSHATDSTK